LLDIVCNSRGRTHYYMHWFDKKYLLC